MHSSTYACLSRANGASGQSSPDRESADRQTGLVFAKLPLPKLENDLQSYSLRLDTRPNSEQNKGERFGNRFSLGKRDFRGERRVPKWLPISRNRRELQREIRGPRRIRNLFSGEDGPI